MIEEKNFTCPLLAAGVYSYGWYQIKNAGQASLAIKMWNGLWHETGVASKTVIDYSSCASLICVYKSLDSVKLFPYFLPIMTALRANHENASCVPSSSAAPETMHKA